MIEWKKVPEDRYALFDARIMDRIDNDVRICSSGSLIVWDDGFERFLLNQGTKVGVEFWLNFEFF